MLIRHMTATFGKLDQKSLSLQPGLNIIYAPNESGKSTWCHFIRTMLYGLPTRDRGSLADKNRFAPWSGAAMRGRMELEAGAQRYTVVRDTSRPAAPMGAFSCTYSDTATAVPDITAQDLGESLLGIGREAFVRSAFIGQSKVALDQDAELERRISTLVSSGQEDISFSESYERLKKQLNRHKHNKTGIIPALEAEISALTAQLENIHTLQEQALSTKEQYQQFSRQVEEIQLRLSQWEAIVKQQALRQCLSAEQQAKAAAERLAGLRASFGCLPSASELARLDGMAAALDQTFADIRSAEQAAQQKQQASAEAQDTWRQHPLYPANETQLDGRLRATDPRRFSLWAVALSCLLGGAIDLALWFFLTPPPLTMISGLIVSAIVLYIYYIVYKRKNRALLSQRTQLQSDIQTYLQLQQQYHIAQEESQQADNTVRSLHNSCRQSLLQLLGSVQGFAPQATNLTNVRGALEQAIERRKLLDQAQQKAYELQLHAQFLRAHLPQGPLPDSQTILPQPTTSHAQLQEALPRTIANLQNAQSKADILSGQLSAAGDRDALESRLAQKQAQLQQAQKEYDSLALAMAALESADLTMQSRFSPALGQRAAEIFSAMTGGKYQKVLLHRDFSLAAEPQGDIVPRSIQLLSQGAADQLYLAVRLAICDMVLPVDTRCPIILDDALANFDDSRLHATLDWLAQEAQKRQILLFTCQKREADYFRERNDIHLLSL